jgi:hypothetical protein
MNLEDIIKERGDMRKGGKHLENKLYRKEIEKILDKEEKCFKETVMAHE